MHLHQRQYNGAPFQHEKWVATESDGFVPPIQFLSPLSFPRTKDDSPKLSSTTWRATPKDARGLVGACLQVRYSFNSRTGLQFESEFARFGYSTAAGEAGTRRFDAVVSDVRDGQMYQLVQRGEGGASSPARAAGDAFTHLVCVSQDGMETAAMPLSAPQRMHRCGWGTLAGGLARPRARVQRCGQCRDRNSCEAGEFVSQL